MESHSIVFPKSPGFFTELALNVTVVPLFKDRESEAKSQQLMCLNSESSEVVKRKTQTFQVIAHGFILGLGQVLHLSLLPFSPLPEQKMTTVLSISLILYLTWEGLSMQSEMLVTI